MEVGPSFSWVEVGPLGWGRSFGLGSALRVGVFPSVRGWPGPDPEEGKARPSPKGEKGRAGPQQKGKEGEGQA